MSGFAGYKIAEFIDEDDYLLDTVQQREDELTPEQFENEVQRLLQHHIDDLGENQTVRFIVYEVVTDESVSKVVSLKHTNNLSKPSKPLEIPKTTLDV